MEFMRQDRGYDAVGDRIQHFAEFTHPLGHDELRKQGARCMDCGVPFCHQGCPVNNIIPDWNNLVHEDKWREAAEVLHSTNNFPEFTGRVCPAPCEASCTLNIRDEPVTIKTIECAIVDKAWKEGWIKPRVPALRTGKNVVIVGSGPAGLACAQQLARAGHKVSVYEKATRIGGLLRYGIPDFKLSKHLIDRRMAQMKAEGVEFVTGVHIGVHLPAKQLRDEFDAIVLACGSEAPRDLAAPGRDLKGVHFALDFLFQQNHRIAGDVIPKDQEITATDKHVVVIGGGDTGSDCVGTAIRQDARSVTQIEIMPKPPAREDKELTWPNWPMKLRTTTSHDEGCVRDWSVLTKSFSGENGEVKTLHAARVQWQADEQGRMTMKETPNSDFNLKAGLVLLGMGFVHPVLDGLLEQLGVDLDVRNNVKAGADSYQTSLAKVFAAGDVRRGQSLVVWAIQEGRQSARAVDEFLMGSTNLPR